MSKKRVLIDIFKTLPIYLLMLIFMYFETYLHTLTGLFMGEVLGILNNDLTVLPDFINQFVCFDNMKFHIITLSMIYLIIVMIILFNSLIYKFLSRYHYEKLYMYLSCDFYKQVLNMPREEFVKHSTGDIIQRNLSDCKKIPDFFRFSLYKIFNIFFYMINILIQLYYLNSFEFIFSLIATVFMIGLSIYYGYYKIEKAEKAASVYSSKLNSTIQQSITNYALVKSFNNEKYEFDKFKDINNKKEENLYNLSNVKCKYWLISDISNSLFLVISFLIIGFMFFNNNMNLAVASSSIVLASKFLFYPSKLFNNIIDILQVNISIKRLNEFFNIDSEYKSEGISTNQIKGNIEFNHVNMKYSNDSKNILNDLTFKINQGEFVAIVGKSGCGKSSLVNLITAMDDYTGSIKIDGVELKDYKKNYLRENIEVVLQDSYIFSKSIKDNLLILGQNPELVNDYIKKVGLDEDIKKFDKGIDTMVGERGVTLSGGQKQRISLVRSMLKKKNILIIDDTLSAIDNLLSKKIRKEIKKEKVTTIIISHNLLNIKNADKIIVLDNGYITQIGTHDELINKEGYYSTVWNLQQKIEEVKS